MALTPSELRRRKMNLLMAMSYAAYASTKNVFTPLQLFAAGEQGAWYDPSDFSTMFQDSAGTTPVTAVEQPVGLIQDKSGRGNHASQSTAASRPVLKQDGNGKYYLFFDGVDDSLATGSIDPGAVDKAQVFAGVRKLSDADQGMLAELSVSSTANNGAFFMLAPNTALTGNYGFRSKGTIAVSPSSAASYAAPITNVLTGIGDISGDNAILRVNASQVAQLTTDQGTGNFLAYPLYIGRRASSTLPFNGHLYSLIVRFSAANLSDAQIASTENYVNNLTGAY